MLKPPGNHNSLQDEDELLRCCARVHQDDATRARFEQLLHEPLDWPELMCRCWWHRIRPLTFRHLSSHAAAAQLVPAKIWDQLAACTEEMAKRNQHLHETLLEVANLFENRGVRMLAFKGPLLALDAYRDLGLRECGDLDLLVHADDLSAVIAILSSNGFAPLEGEFVGANSQTRNTLQVFACEFQRDGISLDVHWDLVPGWLNYRVDFDRLWDRGTAIDENQQCAKKLRPADALVVLCIHGTKHWWERLRWICDIAEFVNRDLITDWNELAEAGTHANCRRSVDLGLWLASDFLAARLPENVQQNLASHPTVRNLARQVHCWQRRLNLNDSSRHLWDRFLFRMRACETTRDCVPQIISYLTSRPPRVLSLGK